MSDRVRWRLPRCDWEYNAAQYKNVGSLRSRFWMSRVSLYNRHKARAKLYEPGWRFMLDRYERALRRRGAELRENLHYWSEHRPRETGYGIHNNDWWHR